MDWKKISGSKDGRWEYLRLTYLEIQPCAPQRPMGVPDSKIKSEALRHEKL